VVGRAGRRARRNGTERLRGTAGHVDAADRPDGAACAGAADAAAGAADGGPSRGGADDGRGATAHDDAHTGSSAIRDGA
jgi:hypothetical protein